jgi:hypothetical protein
MIFSYMVHLADYSGSNLFLTRVNDMVVGGPNSRWQDKARAPGFPSIAIDHLCDPEGSCFWWRTGGGSTLAIPLHSGQVEFMRGGVGQDAEVVCSLSGHILSKSISALSIGLSELSIMALAVHNTY